MKPVEGVRRVTNRIEQLQAYKSKLIRTRLKLVGVVLLLAISVGANIFMFNALTKERKLNNELSSQISALDSQVKGATTSDGSDEVVVPETNTIEVNIDYSNEDVALEAASKAEEVVSGYLKYVVEDRVKTSDLDYTDYILNSSTGERIRTFENANEMFVVYIDNTETEQRFTQELGIQYYLGLEDYKGVVKKYNTIQLVRHDSKQY